MPHRPPHPLLSTLLVALAGQLLALTPVLADEPAAATPPPAAVAAPPPAADPPATPPASLPPGQPAGDPQPPAQPDPPPAEGPAPVSNVHGIGVSLSFSTGAGFAYRRQWGDSSVQITAFGVVTDRGNSSLLSAGGLFAQRLHVWHGQARSILPATSALRVVAGLNYFLNRNVQTQSVLLGDAINGVTCTAPGGCSGVVTNNSSYFNGGAGLGFEFGAIERPGVSLTLDVVLTAALKDGAFSFLLPLPQLAVLYNW